MFGVELSIYYKVRVSPMDEVELCYRQAGCKPTKIGHKTQLSEHEQGSFDKLSSARRRSFHF